MKFARIISMFLVMVALISSCQSQPRAIVSTSPTTTPISIMLPTVIPIALQTVSLVTPTAASISQTPVSGLIALETLGNPKNE